MNLCSRAHEEICYEERDCPFCNYINGREETIKELANQIENLELQIRIIDSVEEK